MKKLITILTFINSVALAQDFQGYVILNSGDTLRGQIKPYEDAYDILMYTEVRFFKDGEKIKFTPKEIRNTMSPRKITQKRTSPRILGEDRLN